MTRFQRSGLSMSLVSLLAMAPIGGVSAQGADDLWAHLRGLVERGETSLNPVLERQREIEAADRDLEQALEHSRAVRQMHREALFLSGLNIAWVRDQLEHWDCRLAEHKQREAQLRVAELRDFAERIGPTCTGVGAEAGAQRGVCAQQRAGIERSIADLELLASRYAGQCRGTP